MTVRIEAYDEGELVGSSSYVTQHATRQFIELDQEIFGDVDEVLFFASGGTDADPDDNGSGAVMFIDDIVFA
ncbi:hypothetical protein [Marinibacterium profundimaris]|uniref:Uncharacterized protein n=1 Tax=Marinibacterium profundimaris TaxID=1679460 RepID=A0A225NI79_9RHOB|nr:hypothetical protein [Marinibacterium profundimaris]OWU73562.1 hypothetical protein ATO3_12965 [Marinibacterium profundimaris]